MTPLTKRGDCFYLNCTVGGKRVRSALGTRDHRIAKKRADRILFALEDGPQSPAWSPLRLVLPPSTIETLSRTSLCKLPPSLGDVERKFCGRLDRQVQLGRMAQSTYNEYQRKAGIFFDWIQESGVQKMDEIKADQIESYLIHRKRQLLESPYATNGRGLHGDMVVLKSLVRFCAEENIAAIRLPELTLPKAKVDSAQPLSDEDLATLDANAEGTLRLSYLLLRWTGMRESDVVSLTWSGVDFAKGTLYKRTRKRKTEILVPLSSALEAELRKWHETLRPKPEDTVLPGWSREKLYRELRKFGLNYGIMNLHPHRFRSTLAVDMLSKGSSIYDVAKILGDTVRSVEIAYLPFVDKLQNRVRKVFEDNQ